MILKYTQLSESFWNILVIELPQNLLILDYSRYEGFLGDEGDKSHKTLASKLEKFRQSTAYANLCQVLHRSISKHYLCLTPTFQYGLMLFPELFTNRFGITFVCSHINHSSFKTMAKSEKDLRIKMAGILEISPESLLEKSQAILELINNQVKAVTIHQRYLIHANVYLSLCSSGLQISSNIVLLSILGNESLFVSEFEINSLLMSKSLDVETFANASQVILLKNESLKYSIRGKKEGMARPELAVHERFFIRFIEEVELCLRVSHCCIGLCDELQALEIIYFYFIRCPQGKIVWISDRAAIDLNFTIKYLEFFNDRLTSTIFKAEPTYFVNFESQIRNGNLKKYRNLFEFAEAFKANPSEYSNYNYLMIESRPEKNGILKFALSNGLKIESHDINHSGITDTSFGQEVGEMAIEFNDLHLATELYSKLLRVMSKSQKIYFSDKIGESIVKSLFPGASPLLETGEILCKLDYTQLCKPYKPGDIYRIDSNSFSAEFILNSNDSELSTKAIPNFEEWRSILLQLITRNDYLILDDNGTSLSILNKSNLVKSIVHFIDKKILIETQGKEEFSNVLAIITSATS
jgi:hypothetical protein